LVKANSGLHNYSATTQTVHWKSMLPVLFYGGYIQEMELLHELGN